VTSDLEQEFKFHVKALGISVPEEQYKIIPDRKFRWDFAWPEHKLAIEIQGGTWSGGAHSRGWGIERDCEKHNLAVLAGWRTLLFTGSMVHSGVAAAMLEKALKP
jgi:very-short-patch-repair endonuclease